LRCGSSRTHCQPTARTLQIAGWRQKAKLTFSATHAFTFFYFHEREYENDVPRSP
jgi:hypothetical protein